MKLYHGSKTCIKDALKPNITFELNNWVYATDLYAYALIRSGAFDINHFSVREEHDVENCKHSLCEMYPGAFEELFDRPGYIYVLDESYFKTFRAHEFVSENEVPISNTIYIDNVLEALKKLDCVELIRDEDSEEYWKGVRGGKDGYIQRKQKEVKKVNEAKSQC